MKLNVTVESIKTEKFEIAPVEITLDTPTEEMLEMLRIYPEVLRLMIEVLKELE